MDDGTVTDDPENVPNAPRDDSAQEHGAPPDGGPVDPRFFQRNLAERLFPGPSKQMSEQWAQRVEGLLKQGGNEEAIKAFRDRQNRKFGSPDGSRRNSGVA